MKSKFKVGPAKTRYGKYTDDTGKSYGYDWELSGRVSSIETPLDLMPNCEPEKIVVERVSFGITRDNEISIINHLGDGCGYFIWDDVMDKKWRMTLEEICDD